MSQVRACVREAAAAFGFDETTVMKLVLAVDEACTNIIRHAYKGETHHPIEIEVDTRGDTWEVRIRDYGERCHPSKLKGRELHEVRPGGLGLHFIRQAFDEVHFDHSPEKGTLLILRKRRPPPT
jgi:anti-sigma regulatory factor (Ser/Thr protein kinase)